MTDTTAGSKGMIGRRPVVRDALGAGALVVLSGVLGRPGPRDLLAGDVPCYAWPADDRLPWFPRPTPLARHLVRPA